MEKLLSFLFKKNDVINIENNTNFDFNTLETILFLSNHGSIVSDAFKIYDSFDGKFNKKSFYPVVGSNLFFTVLKPFFRKVNAIQAPRDGLSREELVKASKKYVDELSRTINYNNGSAMWYASTGGRNKQGGIEFEIKVLNKIFDAMVQNGSKSSIPTILTTITYERQREELAIVEQMVNNYLYNIDISGQDSFSHMLIEANIKKNIFKNHAKESIVFNDKIDLTTYSKENCSDLSKIEYLNSFREDVKKNLCLGLRPSVHHYLAFRDLFLYAKNNDKVIDFIEEKYNINSDRVFGISSNLNLFDRNSIRNESFLLDRELSIIQKNYSSDMAPFMIAGLLAYRANTAIDFEFYKNK